MAEPLRHRGPDDRGLWIDPEVGVGLTHCRLSIIDLTAAGHQPMRSPGGRFILVFNGEVYNFRELRRDLDRTFDVRWRGHSDTEVLVAGFELWGVVATLERVNGMFALAVWDREERTLQLARDRVGEKPLYYGWLRRTFVFASELSSLQVHPSWIGALDRHALTLYVRHGYVPTPYSIYSDIGKLPAGTVLTLPFAGRPTVGPPKLTRYWSPASIVSSAVRDRHSNAAPDVLVARLDTLLRKAVRLRMEADVPLGAFLSGGIDSSLVTALMQAESTQPIKTFTVAFPEHGYNEAPSARSVAAMLRTDHTEMEVTSAQAQDVIPLLPHMFSEPFADSSQIPTYLVSRFARQHVAVALSGDGGDELFGGYNRYVWGRRILNSRVPPQARGFLARALRVLSPTQWDAVLTSTRRRSGHGRISHPGDSIHKLADVLTATDVIELYTRLTSQWHCPEQLVVDGALRSRAAESFDSMPDVTPIEQMMYMDLLTYLPDDILVKLDRASMRVSLETRVPLLDPDVIEFAWRLPLGLKVNGNEGKWLLRRVLYRYVPAALLNRPKMGFGVPIDSWLRGPLRDWAEDLLRESTLLGDGLLNSRMIRTTWSDHLSQRRNRQHQIWNVLMFQAWLQAHRAFVST